MIKKIKEIFNQVKFGERNPNDLEVCFFYNKKIIEKTNSLFIHIPKTAGIAFQYGLYGNKKNGHIPIEYYMDNLDENLFNRVFKYTIVRDPYQRLYSAYNYLKNGGRGEVSDLKNKSILDKYETFENFVLNFFKTDLYLTIEHFVPQTFWITDRKGDIRLDYIGLYENIEKEFSHLKIEIFGNESKKILPKRNVTLKNEKEVYTKEMIEVINKVYDEDFKKLNYYKKL